MSRCSPGHVSPHLDPQNDRNGKNRSSYFWPDGMVRVAGREYNGLIESPCYQRGELSCLSCHRMHPDDRSSSSLEEWRNDQLKAELPGDRACLKCHEDFADRIAEHTHHAIDSSGSNCLNCHMPHTTYGLLKTIRSHQIDSPSVGAALSTGRPTACNHCHLDRSLGWTAEHLKSWYSHDIPELTETQLNRSAAVHDLLTGDAAQRVVQAAAFGRQSAQAASGTDWMPPFLLVTLNDPYDAVRQIALRSLRSLSDHDRLEAVVGKYHFLQKRDERTRVILDSLELWEQSGSAPHRADLFFDTSGKLKSEEIQRLIQQQDDSAVDLQE